MNLRTPSLRQPLLCAAAIGLTACLGDGAALRFSVNEAEAKAASVFVQGAEATATPAPTFRSSDGIVFTLTEARIHLRDIRLDLPQGTRCAEVSGLLAGATCKGSDSSGTVLVPGPIIVDLMTGATTPDLSGLRLPSGNYKRIDFRLEEAKADEVASGEPLVGYSLLVKASFTRDNAANTLDLALKFSEDARFESTNGVAVDADTALLALLQPQVWLDGLPVATCLSKGDLQIANNVLRIDGQAKGDCGDAETRVKSNIKNSGQLRTSKD